MHEDSRSEREKDKGGSREKTKGIEGSKKKCNGDLEERLDIEGM